MKVIMIFTHILTALLAFIIGIVSGAFSMVYFYHQLKDILDPPRTHRARYSSYYWRGGDDE